MIASRTDCGTVAEIAARGEMSRWFILAGIGGRIGERLVVVHNGAFHNIALYFVYFLAAVHAGRWSVRIVGRTRLWHAVALLALFVTLSWADLELGLRAILGFRMVVSVAAIACGLTVAFQLARLPHTTWVRMLGRRTLPIYLLHFYPVLWTAVASIPSAAWAASPPR